jgi:PAS domain S-box-containing protein
MTLVHTENNPPLRHAEKRPAHWPNWLKPQLLPVLVLLISLGVTYWLWQAAQKNVERDLQASFDFRIREVSAGIEQRMKSYEQILRGVGGLFGHDDDLNRDGFRYYVQKLRLAENYSGIQGLGFSLIIPAAQKEKHTSAVRKDGFADYTIKPDGLREIYSPIIYVEPFSGFNESSLGFDPFSSPVSRTAMERSRDLDKPIISRMMKLRHGSSNADHAGFMMYLPVFGIGLPQRTFAERRANIAGWVYASFRMTDLMDGILGERADDIAIRIYDGEVINSNALMYDVSGDAGGRTGNTTPMNTTHYLGIGGHTWALVITSLPGFEAQVDIDKPKFIAKIMLGGSFLLALLSWLFIHGRTRALADAGKLAVAEASYRSMFDNALDAVFLLRDNLIVDCNTPAQTLFGCRHEQILARTLVRFSSTAQANGRPSSDLPGMMEDSLHTGDKIFEWLFRRYDGALIYCDVAVRRIVVDGEALILANVHDITARKKAEEEIKRTSAELETIVQSALVGICYISERRHQWVNNKFAEMMGYEPEELIGQQTLIHFPDEKSWQAIGELAYPVITQGQPFSIDWQMKRKDGSIFWAELFGKAVDDLDIAKGTIWTYLDITKRKQAEEEIKAALEQQKELYQLKSRFVSMTSHEFRTPLATIMSSAELLKYYSDRMPPEERAEVIESIEKAVKRMTRMLEDILTIGKVDADKIEFRPELLPLRKFCEGLVNEIPLLLEDADKGKCVIELQIIGESGEVNFDERLLHHIFGNLLSNAVKYSPAGGKVFFGVVCRPSEIEFTVADQGIGLPGEDVAHLFETFYRASNVGNIAGTGLGLAIVKRSVELHSGSIKVDSILGTGTRFVVTLPTAAPATTPSST